MIFKCGGYVMALLQGGRVRRGRRVYWGRARVTPAIEDR